MIAKWTAVALVCFALPWVEIKREDPVDAYGRREDRGTVRLSQSGHHMTYGGQFRSVTPPPDLVRDQGGRVKAVLQPEQPAEGRGVRPGRDDEPAADDQADVLMQLGDDALLRYGPKS